MIFRSGFAAPSIPDQEISTFVLSQAGEHPDRPAFDSMLSAVTG